MTAEQNKQAFRLIIEEAFSKGNLAVLDDLFVPGYTEHQFGLHTTVEGLKKDITYLRNAFPDFKLTIEDMVCDGDTIWVRSTATGTNLGPFVGPPTGKKMQATVFDVLRFNLEGKITDHWGVPDRFAVIQQLGILPQQQNGPRSMPAQG